MAKRRTPRTNEVVKFTVDGVGGWVRATFADGGSLKSQSVEAHLLFAILRLLKRRK